MNQKKIIYNLSDIDIVADQIAKELIKIKILLLKGDLGVGKTTLTKHIVKNLGSSYNEVTSPTFNLVHRYNTKKQQIWHFDLYRIKSSDELLNLGIEDALQHGIAIIEWGEIAKKYLASQYLQVHIIFTANIKTRKMILTF